jgi:ferredoxin
MNKTAAPGGRAGRKDSIRGDNMKEMLRDYARSIGLTLFGVASAERFDGLPKNVHPASILPEVRSVIVIGADIPRGNYRGVEEGTLWNFASKYLDQRLVLDMARTIVQQTHFEAVPYLAQIPKVAPRSRPVAPDRPMYNVTINLEYAAVAAGLGEISLLGQLLTPQYGNRNALGVILTELELEPDPIFAGTLCDGLACGECIAVCPARSINPAKTVTIDICGRQTVLAEINYNLCRLCPNGAAPDFINKVGQEELMVEFSGNQPKIVETSTALTRRNVPNIATAVCARTCLNHLEKTGRLTQKYVNPFRDGEPWRLETWER